MELLESKTTQTQQVLQRRPRIQADIYPIKSKYFVLRQYNLVKLPLKQTTEEELDDESSEGNIELKEPNR